VELIEKKVDGSRCLHCGKPVNTAQRAFYRSIYGTLSLYTVNGPFVQITDSASWCDLDCLLAWLRDQMQFTQSGERVSEPEEVSAT